jgi:type IV pilus assembly protein PilB
LTTFHTEDNIGGLVRLLNMNIEAFLISSTVVCVLAQRLLRHVCPACAEPYLPTSLDMSRLGYSGNDLIGAEFKIGRGCRECRFTGYKGRTGVFELLVMNEMVKDAILNKRSSYEIRRISIETSGLLNLLKDGLTLSPLPPTKGQDESREEQSTRLKRSGSMQTGIDWKNSGRIIRDSSDCC